MVGDDVFRQCVSALWTLIGALREAADESAEAPLLAALEAIRAARGDDNYLLIHEAAGALHVSGRMLVLGVDIFAAASGLAQLLREQGIGEVLFDENVDRHALLAWARSHALGAGHPADPDTVYPGIHTSRRMHDDVTVPIARSAPTDEAPDSRLRSTFLQHHLIAVFGSSTMVPPHVAKVAIGAVVERMLAIDGGMEPLTLLQRDEALLRRSVHVAVLAVVLARVIGWPEDGLADLGCAALLHDIGQVIDADEPERAGFAWLLERGTDPFWLQSAVVARSWRADHGGRLSDLGPSSCLVAAVVRAVVTVARCEPAAGASETCEPVERALLLAAECGEFPQEIADAALRALACYA